MPILDDVVAGRGFAPREWQVGAPPEGFGRWARVSDSEDLRRVLALPRRPQLDLASPRAATLVAHVTNKFARRWPDGRIYDGSCLCTVPIKAGGFGRKACITRLLPVQAWALHEISLVGGLLGPVAVGAGKSYLDLLAPLAMSGCRLAVALVPPSLAKQLERDYNLLRQHFRVPRIEIHGANPARSDGGNEPMLHVVPYSMLSQPKSSDWLRLMQPDTIIADEVHLLKDPKSARTRRVLRYYAEFGATTRFCGWSGSITDSSLSDYAHLAALALRYGSPLPLDPLEVENWGRAIDASDNPADPGALLDGLVEAGCCAPGEHVQDGYRRRFVETLGVVATTASAVTVDLVIEEKRPPSIPQEIRDYITQVRDTMVRPDGEELLTPLEVAKCARELACGFYYFWRFVNGETPEMVKVWRDRRRDFHRELREKLKDGAEHMDSPGLCEYAAQRAHGQRPKRKDRPEWASKYWLPWCAVKDTVHPITEAERVNDYLVRDAADWGRNHRGIIWYEAREVGAWIAELSGLPQHTGGKGATERIDAEDGSRSIIASILSHGTGRDGLQFKFDDQLIIQFPSSAVKVEQWLGRLVRTGQEATRVRALYYGHTKELASAKAEAMTRASYVQRSTGIAQLLNAAR